MEKMYFKDISYLQLWRPIRCRVGPCLPFLFLHLCKNYFEFGPGVQEEVAYKDVSN